MREAVTDTNRKAFQNQHGCSVRVEVSVNGAPYSFWTCRDANGLPRLLKQIPITILLNLLISAVKIHFIRRVINSMRHFTIAALCWICCAFQAVVADDSLWWSLSPVKAPEVPAGTHPIDHFVALQQREKGLRVAKPADERTLIRRLFLDLTGLPPTPDDVDAFVRESQTDAKAAYLRLVDRLLASPHYGERQARHWLDVVRFSESDGFEEDEQRNEAWTYRDYVVRAFNEDLPYDQFVREQIAGDVLKPVTGQSIAATGMLVAGPWDAVQRVTPSKIGRLQSREEQLEEIVATVSQTFLAMTVNCARCHDHKFDPIPQVDYYRVKSVFEGVDHSLKPKQHGTRRMLGEEEEVAWNNVTEALREKIAEADKQVRELEKQLKDAKDNDDLKKQISGRLDEARKSLAAFKSELETLFPVTLAFVGEREQPQPTVLFERGDVHHPKQAVTPGGLSAIEKSDFGLPENAPEAERRIRFAQWLAQPNHPLTARVMVNRVWQWHFGKGLVETSSDFGINGAEPSHPELLDWLAAELVRNGWRIKPLQRLILSSATYRQSSLVEPATAEKATLIDADNRLLWKFPSRNLEGEVVRDALLASSSALNRAVGGPSFKPFTTTRLNTFFYHLFDKDEPAFNRRSIYRMHIITGRSPLLDALDCPSPSVTTPTRRPTVTPLQALALMNDGFVVRQADKLAERLATSGKPLPEQVSDAFVVALSRSPTVDELAASVKVAETHGLQTVCWSLFNSSEFLTLR